MKNLANQFSATATENCEKTAIYWGEEHYTFGQAHAVAVRLAKRLREEHGLQTGDRVGLWLKNCP